jgi:hypothetical protein
VINDLTRLVTQWMKHAEHGVNPLMAQLGRKRVDGAEDPMPAPVAIFDDVDTEELVLEMDPPVVPAIVVWVDSDADVNLLDTNYLKTGEPVIVAFAYVTQDVLKVQAKLDGGYALRAVRQSLRRLNRNRDDQYRKLNGIHITGITVVNTQIVAGGVGKSQMWGLLYAAVHVVDTAP